MMHIQVNFDNQESILHSFDHIASRLANDIKLRINNAYYRIVDFEFYNYSDALPDPHTYRHPLQLENSKFYLHASGVDITFGDGVNYGGILLKGIIRLGYDSENAKDKGFMSDEIHGPQKVATELFSNLHDLNSQESNVIALIDIEGNNQDACHYPAKTVIKTRRVGLTVKPNDPEDFYMNLPIRYIAIMQDFKGFRQSRKGYENLLKEQVDKSLMTIADAQEILRYQLNFG